MRHMLEVVEYISQVVQSTIYLIIMCILIALRFCFMLFVKYSYFCINISMVVISVLGSVMMALFIVTYTFIIVDMYITINSRM